MSNKAISIYAEALKRQQEEETKQPPSPMPRSRAHVVAYARKEPTQQGNKATRNLVEKEPAKDAAREAALEPDLPTKPELYRKQTFEFSEAELEFLEEAKTTCRRRFGFRVAKNEMVRTALEFLAKDFRVNQETSFLVRKFAGKEPGRRIWNR